MTGTVFICGGSGVIGSAIARDVCERGIRVDGGRSTLRSPE